MSEVDKQFQDELMHYGRSVKDGAPVGSGRYPLGSGTDPQSYKNFLDKIAELEDLGYKPSDMAKYFEIKGPKGQYSTDILKRKRSIAVNEWKKYEISEVRRLKDEGKSNPEIAKIMGFSGESKVRSLLKSNAANKGNEVEQTADKIESRLQDITNKGYKYIQVGEGVEALMGVSKDRLNTAVELLKDRGYEVINVQVDQLGTGEGKKTTIPVLAPAGTTYKEVKENYSRIGNVIDVREEVPANLTPPTSIDSKRVYINYTKDDGTGGAERDGLIQLRPGVQDISLGKADYAQVRIAVDDKYYLKGMAAYSDKIPDGYDIIFNTNKKEGTPMGKVFKEMSTDKEGNIDLENPFGASIKEDKDLKMVSRYYTDENGVEQKSAINVVNEQGDWYKWKDKLSSQFLSKQLPEVAKKQLNLTYAVNESEFEDIKKLTIPAIRQYELNEFATQCDSAAEQLKALGFAGQKTKVILPFPSIKDGEIYDPNFKDGEQVALIRFPHAGTFEIPICTVNNKNKEAKQVIGNGKDAVGINANTAQQLSGADFDGDTAVVVPLSSTKIKNAPAIKELQEFDAKKLYKVPEEKQIDAKILKQFDTKEERDAYIAQQVKMGKIKQMDSRTKGLQMGEVSNLITDMTLHDAPIDEIVRAVKHSQVVIDAQKHYLDWQQSAKDNGIAELKAKYQRSARGGASTLISQAKATTKVPERTEITRASLADVEKGKITKEQYDAFKRGERVYKETGATYKNFDEETQTWYDTGKLKMQEITRMQYVKDAEDLSSGTVMESIYANYANKMKSLANKARKEARAIERMKQDSEAKQKYADCDKSLRQKVVEAKKNKPLEKQAQIIANAKMDALREANPDLEKSDIKKWKNKYLTQARALVGAKKQNVEITDREWEAIQNKAISDSLLRDILSNTDRTVLKERAMPRETKSTLSNAKISVAKARLAAGFTQADVAEELGVSVTTLLKYV